MLEQDLKGLEELSTAQAVCAERASTLFECLHELSHLEVMRHCQLDHVKLLQTALYSPDASSTDGKIRDEMFLEIVERHTLSVLQKAAR